MEVELEGDEEEEDESEKKRKRGPSKTPPAKKARRGSTSAEVADDSDDENDNGRPVFIQPEWDDAVAEQLGGPGWHEVKRDTCLKVMVPVPDYEWKNPTVAPSYQGLTKEEIIGFVKANRLIAYENDNQLDVYNMPSVLSLVSSHFTRRHIH